MHLAISHLRSLISKWFWLFVGLTIYALIENLYSYYDSFPFVPSGEFDLILTILMFSWIAVVPAFLIYF